MKKLLLVAVALASTNAFATRARVTALGNAPHLIDTQTVYSNPADIMMMGDYVTLESGATAPAAGTSTNYAEGMFTRSMSESLKFGLSLGHQSENASAWASATQPGLRATAGFATIKGQQNPLELFIGGKASDLAWGATLVYSNFNDKVANEKESSAGVRAGMRMGALDVKAGLGLVNTYENAVDGKFKGTLGANVGAGYMLDNGLYVNGGIKMAGYKTEDINGAETRKLDTQTISLGVASSTKKDGAEVFYGAGLENVTTKINAGTNEIKKTSLRLPLIVGLEVEAASWLALRGSVTQNTIINNNKTETNGTANPDMAPDVNSTVAAVGTGFKWNKLTMDATLNGLTGGTASQKVDGTDLFATVGMTYMF